MPPGLIARAKLEPEQTKLRLAFSGAGGRVALGGWGRSDGQRRGKAR